MNDAPEPSISARVSRAAGWSFGNTIASRLGTLVIGVALARVLGPEQFGVFAIATVTLLAILSFNELGVSLAVIRWRDKPETIAPTINTIAVASSAALTALMIVAAPWISALLGDARATPVVRVLAVSVLLNGLVATSAAILQREFMQKRRTIADQVNTWLGAALSLVFALFGWGAMSLAIGRLIASVVFGLMLIRWSPVPYRFGWDPLVAKRLLGFGLPLAASSIVVFASGYADQMIVGSLLGAQVLGFYVLAFNLASWPVSIFSQPLRAVAPAAFSALRSEPERMSRNFVRVLAILSCVAVPACLAISGASVPVVQFVYGRSWAPAASILLWLALFAALRIWFELAYDYLVVKGKPTVVLLIQCGFFVAAVPLMLLLVRSYGAQGVAAAQVLVALVVVVPLYLGSLSRVGVRVGSIRPAIVLPVLSGVAVWFTAWGLSRLIALPFLAVASAGLCALAVVAALGYHQRDTLRRLRSTTAVKEAV